MALALFADEDYEEVAIRLTETLAPAGGARGSVPAGSGELLAVVVAQQEGEAGQVGAHVGEIVAVGAHEPAE
jgi:hypothetical protein